ncbi:MAG: radical SAM protein [Candidatus Omnitrophota bacterium]
MKILLANIPWINKGRWGVRAGSRWPHIKDHTESDYLPFPFYLAYAAALLKKHGFEVVLIDAIAMQVGYKEFLQKVESIFPDLMVAEISTVSLEHDLDFLKQIGKDIPLALCGPDVNIRNPEFIKSYHFVKYVLIGEYENILLELAQCLSQNKDLSSIKGLIYRNGSNSIRLNTGTQIINDLDDLPWPLRENMSMLKYRDLPGGLPEPSVQMWASRGCPFQCKFCLWPQVMYFNNHYRSRSIHDVVDEMEYLVKKKGFKSIYFDDDTWNVGKNRVLQFCRELKTRNLNTPWAVMARPDLMDEEILDNLKDAGLYSLKYGVESATQELLDSANKAMDLKKAHKMVRYTKKIGIKMHLTFTFGLDGETKETIQKTIKYAIELDPHSVQFSIATPFPGTRFYHEAKTKGQIMTHKLTYYDGNYSSVIKTERLTAQKLTAAKKIAYKLWQEYCYKRNSYKKEVLKPFLIRKFISVVNNRGLLKAVIKTFDFLRVKTDLLLKKDINHRGTSAHL